MGGAVAGADDAGIEDDVTALDRAIALAGVTAVAAIRILSRIAVAAVGDLLERRDAVEAEAAEVGHRAVDGLTAAAEAGVLAQAPAAGGANAARAVVEADAVEVTLLAGDD